MWSTFDSMYSDAGHPSWIDARAMISAMKTGATKLLSIFVVAFLCLNAGAFFCFAHCNTITAAEADHCPLKKASSHCHRSKVTENKDDACFSGASITCCMLPVGVFAAPLEQKSGTISAVPVTPTVTSADFMPTPFLASRRLPKFYYRPPPNDARVDRVRNQVFRI